MKSLSYANRYCPLAEKPLTQGSSVRASTRLEREGIVPGLRQDLLRDAGTPYYRLQLRRGTFDEVTALSVEGLNKSAIARVKRIGWNTVDR